MPSMRTWATILLIVSAVASFPVPCGAEDGPTVRFGETTIDGNLKTDTSLIMNELLYREGDPFDDLLLDRTWEHLEDLGYFAFVEVDYEIVGDRAMVEIKLEEDDSRRGYPILDYDRRHDILLGARIYDINLRGRGETLSARGIWFATHRYEADWSHPWLFGVRGLTLGLGGAWENGDFVYRDFDFTSWRVSAQLEWRFTSACFASIDLGYRYFDQEADFTGSPGSWPAAVRRSLAGRLVLGYDSRDLTWYPTRGAYHRLILRRVDGRDHADYIGLVGDLRQFVPLPWDHVLALRAWGRLVDAHVPPEDMLYWGGPDNLRGYRYATVEGEEGFILSVEYRWPLFLMPVTADGKVIGIGLHAFSDGGAAWFNHRTRDPLFSCGIGAHLNIGTHQFRFEMARTEYGETVFQFMDAFNF